MSTAQATVVLRVLAIVSGFVGVVLTVHGLAGQASVAWLGHEMQQVAPATLAEQGVHMGRWSLQGAVLAVVSDLSVVVLSWLLFRLSPCLARVACREASHANAA